MIDIYDLKKQLKEMQDIKNYDAIFKQKKY